MSSDGLSQPPSINFGDPGFTRPWATYFILLTLAAVYGAELYFSFGKPVDFAPSAETLIALGGLNRDVMLATHEWYRVFTAALLHAGPAHLLFNGIGLYFAGLYLERLVGRYWFFAFFALGALGGTLTSLAANAPDITSVGASGGIMALFAAQFTISFRLPERSRGRSLLQAESLRILVPSLLPLASISGLHTDLAGHLGGTITGAVMAFVVLKTWPAHSPLPPRRGVAAGLAFLGVAAFLLSFGGVALHYPTFAKNFAQLIPDSEIPKDTAAERAKASELLKRYPRDPRAHMLRAEELIDEHNLIAARFEMEAALPLAEEYRYVFSLKLANTIRITLAMLWVLDGAQAEAAKVAHPACKASYSERPDVKVYGLLDKYHLCE